MTRRVVNTGMGTVNPLCSDVPGVWTALCAGRSGIDYIEQFDTSKHKVKIAGEVKDFEPGKLLDAREVRRIDRFAQFALIASAEAVKDSGLDFSKEDPFRCG